MFRDLTGVRSGKLVACWPAGRKTIQFGENRIMWLCVCDCGNLAIVKPTRFPVGQTLRSGRNNSCGCEKAKARHGQSRGNKTREYVAWQAMRARCEWVNGHAYQNYGGRGIRVCERWRESFDNFFADMGLKPSAKHSLDRYPDNNGNYEPGNCRWATVKEQSLNKRTTHKFPVTHAEIRESARRLGMSYRAITGRFSKGWSVERALNEPRHRA